MGTKKVKQLLEQLKFNQEIDLQNTIDIFSVSQLAVNEIRQQALVRNDEELPSNPLFVAPVLVSKDELLDEYGSYNSCRKAAKDKGIQFSRTPSWSDLGVAFSYTIAIQSIVNLYIERYPHRSLSTVKISLKLG